jgi:hypothetical protein
MVVPVIIEVTALTFVANDTRDSSGYTLQIIDATVSLPDPHFPLIPIIIADERYRYLYPQNSVLI